MYAQIEGDVKGKGMISIRRAQLIEEYHAQMRVLKEYDKMVMAMNHDRENQVDLIAETLRELKELSYED